MNCFIMGLMSYWPWLAFAFSLFWGTRSSYLFTKHQEGWDKFFWVGYQFFLNFFCSFAGWACLHILVIRGKAPFAQLSLPDLILFLLSLLGITGTMPQLIVKLPEAAANALQTAKEQRNEKTTTEK